MVVAYALIGLMATGLARRGIGPLYLPAAGMACSLPVFLLIITRATDQTYLLWIGYGVFSSFGTLVYPQASATFDLALCGRVNTLINLMCFVGAFGLQWGMGIFIDILQAWGYAVDGAYRLVSLFLFALQLAACFCLLLGGRPSPQES